MLYGFSATFNNMSFVSIRPSSIFSAEANAKLLALKFVASSEESKLRVVKLETLSF